MNEITQSDICPVKSLTYLLVRTIFYLGLFYKSEKFAGEKEYRFVYMPSKIEECDEWQNMGIPYKEEFRIKNGVLIPYQKCSFSNDSVVSVMCGPSLDYERMEAGVSRLLSYEFKKVKSEIHRSGIRLRY